MRVICLVQNSVLVIVVLYKLAIRQIRRSKLAIKDKSFADSDIRKLKTEVLRQVLKAIGWQAETCCREARKEKLLLFVDVSS
jgi:hypothetical protein